MAALHFLYDARLISFQVSVCTYNTVLLVRLVTGKSLVLLHPFLYQILTLIFIKYFLNGLRQVVYNFLAGLQMFVNDGNIKIAFIMKLRAEGIFQMLFTIISESVVCPSAITQRKECKIQDFVFTRSCGYGIWSFK
jgi:hypothetical protein